MGKFKREERYIVVKIDDLDNDHEVAFREFLDVRYMPTRECVVVESDWPIYDETWENVQRLAEGRPSIQDELSTKLYDQHKATVRAEKERDAAESILDRFRDQNEKLKVEHDKAIANQGAGAIEEYADMVERVNHPAQRLTAEQMVDWLRGRAAALRNQAKEPSHD